MLKPNADKPGSTPKSMWVPVEIVLGRKAVLLPLPQSGVQ
jgi:hypothetical protein